MFPLGGRQARSAEGNCPKSGQIVKTGAHKHRADALGRAEARAWRTFTLRPGPAPVVELANQLHHALVGDDPCEQTASALGAAVQHRAAALGEFIAAHLPVGEGLVLLVDQLEEALLVPDAGPREAFAAALAEMLVRSPRPLLLITALRSDFSARRCAIRCRR